MKPADAGAPATDSVAAAPWPVANTILAVLAIALLWGAATALVRLHRTERHQRAAREAALGRADEQAARPRAALVHYREAVALEPDEIDHRVRLGRVLIDAGRLDEAASYLRDVLQDAPVDGTANLLLARVQRARGLTAEAESSYYRAIYGIWPPDQQRTRVDVRLELIALLQATANRDRVSAELSQLASAFPGDVRLQLRVARSLLDLGFPDASARLYRLVARRFTDAGSSLEGLAEAEIARGDYASAMAAATEALRRDPRGRASVAYRDLAMAALALDPTQPRLSDRERSRRTETLLRQARGRLVSCRPGGTPSRPDLLRLVQTWLTKRDRRRPEEQALGFALAEAMALEVTSACPKAAAPPVALDLVLRKLAAGDRS
jgi:tetratricopeptide (TPR) repeat protein